MIRPSAMILSFALLYGTGFSHNLNMHKAGEEVCDMHAFSQYNKHLALNHYDELERTSEIAKHKPSTIHVFQFCSPFVDDCAENDKSLAILDEYKDVVIHNKIIITDLKFKEATAFAALVKQKYGEKQYENFLIRLKNKGEYSRKYINEELKVMKINYDDIEVALDKIKKNISIDSSLAKKLKITNLPSVLIIPKDNPNLNNTYFSEYKAVPYYIMKRAYDYVHKYNQMALMT